MKGIRRLISFVMTFVFVIGLFLPFIPLPAANAAITITVTATTKVIPGYIWCQHYDGHWSTDSTLDGQRNAPDAGGEPALTRVRTAANISPPDNALWQDEHGDKFTYSQVGNIEPASAIVDPTAHPLINGVVTVQEINGQKRVVIEGNSGKGVPYMDDNQAYCGHMPSKNYPFPIIVTWQGTVTFENGIAHIRHFTTDGQSLGHVFPDRDEKLIHGQTYNFTAPNHPDYRYVGYKKRQDVPPESGPNWTSGSGPGSFKYDSSQFSKYYVYFYYDPPDKPDLVAVDITANGPIEVGKPVDFTAKWRVDNKATGQPYNVKIMVDGRELKSKSQPAGGPGNYAMDFTYTFASPEQKTFLLVVDSANGIAESNEDNNQLSKSFKPSDSNKSFDGDFDVLPPAINYRDPFALKPKNLVMNGCTYDGHRYKIERDGWSNYTSWASGQNTIHSYAYSSYPSVIAVGTHVITLEIRTKDCGTKQTATHTLVVNGPSHNSPPTFQVAWVRPGTNVPVSQVFEGETLDLIFIDDPSVPTPHDPDGDPIYWRGFDFSDSSDWAKTIPDTAFELYNGWGYIRMTAAGTQIAKGTMCDSWGACETRTAVVHVVTEDPVPVITAPREVVEDRPVTPPIHGDYSYSPVPGRTIDHSRDIWTNRKTVYTEPGTEVITLEVFDNTGRKSREPARHSLTVKPDLPPVPVLEYITPSIRDVELTLTDESYSPDGDTIVERRLTYQYDSNNDGSFAGETVVPLPLNAQNKANFKPQRVGKYRFTLYAREDWGREASKTYDLEVINDSPTFSFNVSYEETEPRVSPLIPLPASNLVNNGNWRNMDFMTDNKPKAWGVNPYTGALGHTPENLGIRVSNLLTYTDSYSELYTNNISPGSGGYEVKQVFRFYAGYDDIKEMVYLGNGCFAFNRYLEKESDYLTSVCGLGGNHKYNEWVIRVDYKNQLVYTMTKTLYNPEFRRYRLQDFLRQDGTYNAIVDAKTAGYAQKAYQNGYYWTKFDQYGSMTSSYGYFNCTSYSDGNRFRIFGWDGSLLYEGGNQSCPFPNTYSQSFRYDHLGYDRFANATYVYNGQIYRISGKDASKTVIGPSYSFGEMFLEDGAHYVNSYSFYLYPSGTSVPRENVPINSYRDRILTENDFYPSGRWLVHDAAGYRYHIEVPYDRKTFDVIRVGRDGRTETLAARLDANCIGNCFVQYGVPGYVHPMVDGSLLVFPSSDVMYVLEPKQKQDDSFRILESLQQLAGDKDSSNVELNFQIRFNTDVNQNLYSGFSYNIQDRLNMYRVELNTWRLRLVKLVNGHKTVLASMDVNVPLSERQTVKIKRYADRHIIYFNGVPVMDITDDTYTGGTFGPFSEIFKTEFFNMSYRDLSELGGKNRLQGVGIVGETLQYNTNYSDPENDPRITARTSWTYKHVDPDKFLNAGDGKSGLSAFHNKTYTAEQPVMDKVGVYELSARTMDDPHPEYRFPAGEFDGYRKASNTASQTVIIHRRPISDFDVSVAANGTVVWNDRSCDPDRWLSDTHYSTEPTGIDYRATRGILQRKYYYISPSGVLSETKLVTPAETGWYTVGMAVKDEYDAWSTYTEKTVYVGTLPSPNDPPVAAFTVTPAATYRGVPVTIDSQSWDKEDGGRENLKHTYYLKNVTAGGPETVASASRTTWTKTFSTLGTFQLRLLVEDSLGQPAEAVRTVTIVNRKPQANVTTPASADPANPTRFDVLRPTFGWAYTDADGDAQTQYQAQIYHVNGTLERDTGARPGDVKNWTPTADLLESATMYIRVRVHDGYDWSDWSEPKYFYIETNRPPVADFDWTPKPVYEGDTVRLLDRSSDPDGDPLAYDWQITAPDGDSFEFTTREPSFRAARPGSYTIRLTVSDGRLTAHADRTMDVLPLTIAGEAHHTPEWRERHEAAGHEVERDPKDFYSGEIIRVAAVISAAPADEVTAELRAVSKTGNPIRKKAVLTAAGGLRYEGELHDESWMSPDEGIREGEHTIVFQVAYRNGVTKEASVPIRIIGNIYKAVSVHRVQ